MSQDRLVTIHCQIVLVRSHVESCLSFCVLVSWRTLVLCINIYTTLNTFLSFPKIRHSIVLVLILYKNIEKCLSWLKESNFVILLKNDWRVCLSLSFVVTRQLLREELQLVNIFQWSFVWILEEDCYRDWEFTIPCVMNFKRSFFDCNNWLRKTLVDLKFNFFNHKGQILLLHCILIVLLKTTYVATPLILKWPIFSANTDRPLQGLGDRSYYNWNR